MLWMNYIRSSFFARLDPIWNECHVFCRFQFLVCVLPSVSSRFDTWINEWPPLPQHIFKVTDVKLWSWSVICHIRYCNSKLNMWTPSWSSAFVKNVFSVWIALIEHLIYFNMVYSDIEILQQIESMLSWVSTYLNPSLFGWWACDIIGAGAK